MNEFLNKWSDFNLLKFWHFRLVNFDWNFLLEKVSLLFHLIPKTPKSCRIEIRLPSWFTNDGVQILTSGWKSTVFDAKNVPILHWMFILYPLAILRILPPFSSRHLRFQIWPKARNLRLWIILKTASERKLKKDMKFSKC